MIVSVKNLKKGMVIDSDIFSKKGALLLYKGFKIENPDLVAVVLHRNGINELIIKDETEPKDVYTARIIESNDIKQRIEMEVKEFKEEFNKVLSNVKADVESFQKSHNLADIKDLKRGLSLAKEYENSVLTFFQLVERIKAESHDEYSHMLETSLLAYSLGKWLGKTETELKEICEASLLYSIFEYVGFDMTIEDIHSVKGSDTISKDVLQAAFDVNERSDGSGPRGLSREQIHPYAKVISIIEIYQLLTRRSEVSEGLSVFEAIRTMEMEYITKLDVKSLYIFLHRIGSKFIGSSTRLSDGTVGEIVFVPENEISMPYIKLSDGHVINLQNPQYRNRQILEIF
ncbi:MAG: phosphohydrolase [Peptostreptococcaceae bacterium]|nr:phosphohydrolase [Peptostreptococcaceae bacterium]